MIKIKKGIDLELTLSNITIIVKNKECKKEKRLRIVRKHFLIFFLYFNEQYHYDASMNYTN